MVSRTTIPYLQFQNKILLKASDFKNIIFDLGGVIIDLAVPATIKQFAEVSGKSVDEIRDHLSSAEFLAYEKGLMTDAEFRNVVRRKLEVDVSDDFIDQCWNAMLGEIPKPRTDLLMRLRATHRTFLLSNTNQIHLDKFTAITQQCTGLDCLDHFFDKVYYSHQLRMRKPDKEIFDFVLHANHLAPHETLFLDDNRANLAGAALAGITTFHVERPDDIFSLLS